MSQTLRAFIAIPLPEAVIAFLRQIQQRLRSTSMNVRWVRPENIHLTLKFLGEIDRSKVPAIAVQLDESSAATASFSLFAQGCGVFPNFRRARVLWVGLKGDLQPLGGLQTMVDAALEKIGYERENRPFRAHLTIGRVRQRIDADSVRVSMAALQNMTSTPFIVEQVRLYQSVLRPSGAKYTVLHTASLPT
ncbi:conserved hypothetical protein [Desulfosarcina cetonica]|uniref:RNA 2',3'-cyclic phosphodiesterase n=1 Tax=Desulfosarcina cetonica TaxID=90730 RepID=UPI0006D09349|nr:RNA 2',3'-cyclic phosphodiesterase [Desulfosarcina cetonica]VTR64756.1 conserved hypothetical protein [Desulfosarcina cetonica]